MPPSPRTQEIIERRNTVSTALHALLITAVVIDLVFTEISANRADNDTTPFVWTSSPARSSPSPSPSRQHADVRPVRRLVAFGCCFIGYLAVKSYEITLSHDWFFYKQVVDEVSVIICAISLVVLIWTTTVKFTLFVSLPVLGFLLAGRFVLLWTGWHDHVLETLFTFFCAAPAIDSEVIGNLEASIGV